MKRTLLRLLTLTLCLTLAVAAFGASGPAALATDAGWTVYTFGSADGPVRDLAEEAAQRKKAKKKAPVSDRDRDQREKFARMKARRNPRTD